ncbi:MAG: peroxiredoxin [Candidatus Celaenobacter antarcticus]|nr:peroxiredoxin [Candidatus Celaenobacter antarcticus]
MEEKMNMPLLGDSFPEMEVKTTQGMMKLPDEMAGNWFVLFSHPADFTPVCTTEFVGFQKRMEQFKAMDCKLVGLSIDQVFSHIKWIEWIKDNLDVDIEFPIIAANDSIANKLGLLHPGKGASTVRAVFVVDPKGKVRLILYYPQEIGRNMDEIVRSVKALQLSDTKGIAVPANWPNNELIGDRVIVPPASDMKAVKARKEDKSLECFDWWFCHKDDK